MILNMYTCFTLISSQDTPYGWPRDAIISFKNVNFRYRGHLPPALKGFTMETKSKEKVGIVGRTGAGKSSIFQALYRTSEIDYADEGSSGNEGFGAGIDTYTTFST